MQQIFLATLIFLLLLLPFYLYRAVKGPDVFDRLIGLTGISTKSILILIIIGAYGQKLDMFIDIGLGYALLNLVSSLAVGKYLERREVEVKT